MLIYTKTQEYLIFAKTLEMDKTQNRWYSISHSNGTSITCVSCQNEIQLSPFLDHDPCICNFCEVKCVFLDWKQRKIQIIPELAPDAVCEFIIWMQKELDELEYVELFSSLEEIDEQIEG